MKKSVKNIVTVVESNKPVMKKLKELVLSKYNVRTVSPSKENRKILKASIKAFGIKQNLVTVPENDISGVLAGGCRLDILNELCDEGFITGDYLVPCIVEKFENINKIIAISLAENIKASMHPADEFAAFQSMVKEGKTVSVISNEFGVAQKVVKQRLKLASVSGQLLDLYRIDKIDYEDVMAFTVSDDHERQMACYNNFINGQLNARNIKKFLLDTALLTTHGMVELVTLNAYKKAGGTIISDLFESTTYINDRDLLEDMALNILNKKAVSFKKLWKWVDVALTSYDDYQTELSADFKDIPKALSLELKAKKAAIDELNDKSYEDWTDEDEDLETELEGCIENLENKREQYRNFSHEQKSVSGVVIGFNSLGEITINMGYVKKEDMKLAFPPSDDSQEQIDSNGDNQSSVETPIESNALKTDLENYKLQALQSELMMDDKLTYDLMVFSLASTVIGEDWDSSLPVALSITPYNFNSTHDGHETEPSKRIEVYNDSLDMGWHSHEFDGDRFKAFRELTGTQKKRILSYCTAVSYRSNTSESLRKVISETVSFDITNHWKPTKDNYYSRIQKKGLLKIGGEAMDSQWSVDNETLTKGQIVDKLDCADAMSMWMPETMK